MNSLTKNKQEKEIILLMTEKYFGTGSFVSVKELTEGYFNVAYEVILSDKRKVILKVAPPKGARIMTYEKNIMSSEVWAMKEVEGHCEILAPRVLGYDDSCTICESPYFFMERLEGSSLNVVKAGLSIAQQEKIYCEVGAMNRKINEITCPLFGYPGQLEYQGDNWYMVFSKMLKAGIEDAEKASVNLKIPTNKLMKNLEKSKMIFEEVRIPKLVHWDCWDGNIFVKDGIVTGLIDWERSLWADPLMEVGFRTYSKNKSFEMGYGITNMTCTQKLRALWYDIYLLILMAQECEYRGYETQDMYLWALKMLVNQFVQLEK